MDENNEEYVLQWEGHARHVTERFSGLFARQSLVDVTLICEEQRLRVHKLVLASCSLYFEEMLEQDLGQEPTILLRDLNFQVLKAMVEFMYCGETSVSEQHLEPLLHAAKIFKVKELACIAENMMGPLSPASDQDRNCVDCPKDEREDVDDSEDGNDYHLFSDNDCAESSRWSEEIETDELSGNELEENSYTNVESLENFSRSRIPLSLAELACENVVKFHKEIPSEVKIHMEKMNYRNETVEDVNMFSNEKAESLEQCCDFVNTETNSNACIVNNFQKARSCPEEKTSLEFKEITRTVDKCLKVYTHKRRKSVEVAEKQLVKMIDDLPELPISDNCIDLIDEPSKNETELENDYILSLSNGNVETLVDFVNSEDNSQDTVHYANSAPMSFEKKSRQMKEIFPNDNRIISNEQSDTTIFKSNSLRAPTLRRSVRLSHQENEDSTNNNNNSIQEVDKTKELRKESFKRKSKESDLYCESDENEVSHNSVKKCLNPPRSLRSNSKRKLIERRGGKPCLSLSKSTNKEEQRSTRNNKTANNEACESLSNKFNTIATVSRALWGDMSDYLENSENSIDFADYSPSKEIPFAVGLLPLRAALERMQATPDYQPRKTRSSVTPFRQEFKSVKRKNLSTNIIDSNHFKVKRQNSHSNGNNLPRNTVCHVRITTSHSDSVRTRRRLITEQVDAATISPTNIVNRQ